jgi:hypothetical protein
VNGSPVTFVGGGSTEFGWDCKHAGINMLVSQVCYFLLIVIIIFLNNKPHFL